MHDLDIAGGGGVGKHAEEGQGPSGRKRPASIKPSL